MATPTYAEVINNGKTVIHLQNGHGNSVPVYPKPAKPIKIKMEFVTWTVLPTNIKIIRYLDSNQNQVTFVGNQVSATPLVKASPAIAVNVRNEFENSTNKT